MNDGLGGALSYRGKVTDTFVASGKALEQWQVSRET